MDAFLDFGPSIAFEPRVDEIWLILLGICLLVGVGLAAFGRLGSAFARLLAGLVLMLGLMGPQWVEEERQYLPDTLLIISDRSDSMQIGTRDQTRQTIYKNLIERFGAEFSANTELDIISVNMEQSGDGTALEPVLNDALAAIPAGRLAGVIVLSDGRVHDISPKIIKQQGQALLPADVPFHSLIIGDTEARDRRIFATQAPKFGVVGEEATFSVTVEDPGYDGTSAQVHIKLNGQAIASQTAQIGTPLSIQIPITQRGKNTVEFSVDGHLGELTLSNNLFISEMSGVRDRLRVLLITGEPHSGGRAWRNLLKSDPALDLVQFTILTSRAKYTNATANELSLIQFPTRQLFEETLSEFDLVIFDQYERRSLSRRTGRSRPTIPPQYFQNIAQYVENGGALLLATGPAFAGEASLYRTPLVTVLPAKPTGKSFIGEFRPRLNDKGRRHPITADFSHQAETVWGPWYRLIENDPISGHVLLTGPKSMPLFIIDRVGKGRVAMLMSDQAWLWAKGHKNGGPYREIFRRTAHWLMGEPELDADSLSARREGEQLIVTRRSLSDVDAPVKWIAPDGRKGQTQLTPMADGLYRAEIPLSEGQSAIQGTYRLQNGALSTLAAIGAPNPREYANLRPTEQILAPLSEATGGGILSIQTPNTLPQFRRVERGKKAVGEGWFGLVENKAFNITQSRRRDALPGWLIFTLCFLCLIWGWRQEGR